MKHLLAIILCCSCSSDFHSMRDSQWDSQSTNPTTVVDAATDSSNTGNSLSTQPDAGTTPEPPVITVTADASDSSMPEASTVAESGIPVPDTGPDARSPESSTLPVDPCSNCPPLAFGQKSCCTIYKTCGYITTLGNCTDGKI